MRWSVAKANEWYRTVKWLVGCNYVPSSAINATDMWQSESYDSETIKRELMLASQAGFNTCRIFLQFIVWEHERDIFMRNLADFIRIAKECHMSVMPVFFDDCFTREPYLGKQADPIPGKTNSQWTTSPGFINADNPLKEAALREYVTSIVRTYRDDPTIVVWDLYNEPGASNRFEKCLPLVEKSFEWARSENPVQPLTVGFWEDKEYNKRFLELSDVISFHDYLHLDESAAQIKWLKQYDRPMICTEWLNRKNANTFETHLKLYHRENIGAYNWGLVTGKTQTFLGWNMAENPKSGYPDVWMHDIFYPDGTPYNEKEILLIKHLNSNAV